MKKFISYLRVSTEKQGSTGLGMEAQRNAVQAFLRDGDWILLSEFVEVESGRGSNRSELAKALSSCRIHGATLVVAKLDRLARNAHFLLGLKDAGVEFLCCDMPSANRLTIGIMAMVAEEEAQLISSRTKTALAAARRRGTKLGTPNLTPESRRQGCIASSETRGRAAKQRALDLAPMVAELQAAGHHSLSRLAAGMNDRGVPANRGGTWSPAQVARLLRQM